MADGEVFRLPLASLPDGALAILLSFGEVADLVIANQVCRAWVMEGNRADLWASVGKHFEVTMPVSLGPVGGARAGAGGGARQKRALRSGSNARRTFLKSWASAVKADRIKHDATLSEAYTLFRMRDSVGGLRALLRRKWGIVFQAALKAGESAGADTSGNATGAAESNNETATRPHSPAGSVAAVGDPGPKGTTEAGTTAAANAAGGCAAHAWRGRGRWTFDVNHRHGIFEGNTMLNFAVRCGRRKCVEFILWRMGADTEIGDYGGFTPVLNTAWRGDLPLLKQLLAAGARLDVQGVSRGVGPLSPLGWAERKNRPVTAAFLRRLATKERQRREGQGGRGEGSETKNARAEKEATQADVLIGAP